MKKSIWLYFLIITLCACGGGDDSTDAPVVNKDYLNVPPSLELLADGQTTDITVSANCSWTITKDADWLTVSPTSGTNTQTVTVSAGKNTTKEDRVAVLSIKGGSLPARRVTVTQMKGTETPVSYSLSVDSETISFENKGGTQNFIITSNTSWTISCPDWCSLSISSGKGNATISVSVGENTITEPRSGQIRISGDGVSNVVIQVSQKAGEAQSHQPGSGDNLPPS